MANLAEILGREFQNAREKGVKIKRSVIDEANFLETSNPHLSRLRNEKAPLTRNIADKIINAFDKYTTDKKRLRSELEDIIQNQVQTSASLGGKTESDAINKYSIKKVEDLFDIQLARTGSILCVEYRDLPQADEDGAFPYLALKAGRSVEKGLCFSLFQPFGSVEAIEEMISDIAKKISHEKAYIALEAYGYLHKLAKKVRDVYKKMKSEAEKDNDCKGQIVLYEADIKKPLIPAIGFQSRLFLANYFDEEEQRVDRIFEWVAALNKEHFFIERTQLSLSLSALRLQFHPIHKFWEESGRKELPQGKDLSAAYKKFKIEELLGENIVKWKDWSE